MVGTIITLKVGDVEVTKVFDRLVMADDVKVNLTTVETYICPGCKKDKVLLVEYNNRMYCESCGKSKWNDENAAFTEAMYSGYL